MPAPTSVWILGDQLVASHPAIAAAEQSAGRENVRVVIITSAARISQLPYHRKKLVLLLSAMQHYADSLRDQGYVVDEQDAPDFLSGLHAHISANRPARLVTMAASEYATRSLQQALAKDIGLPVDILPNTQFLINTYNPFPEPGTKRIVMATFYRRMRTHFDVLMQADGEPVGGRWSFDEDNRRPIPRSVIPPAIPSFEPDAVTRSVMERVAALPNAFGSIDGFNEPVTHAEAQHALEDFLANRLANFGPYEDAMRAKEDTLFHSRLSPLLNIGLLEPLDLVRAAEAAHLYGGAPLNCVEGFVRQILGWREYIAWHYWRQMPDLPTANAWSHFVPLPAFFWDAETDLACLHAVLKRVIATGYSHHIERLMVLCNFCMLAGINPRAVAEWFLSLYMDAYEWVVLPNVIGMGLNADGGLTATKPYIAAANYINKMSDYCKDCRYDPKQRLGPDACPFNALYWDFLIRNEARLRANPRSGPAVLGVARLSSGDRAAISHHAGQFRGSLAPYPTATPPTVD